MGGMCFHWKVLAGLATVGPAIWALAPNAVGSIAVTRSEELGCTMS